MPPVEEPEPIRVRPISQQALSMQDVALQEAGKALLTSSATTGRDFAKVMAPVCTGAITLYFAAIKAVAPNKSQFDLWDGLVILVPAMTFLLSSVCFILAFVPRLSVISLNVVGELTAALERLIVRQHRWNRAGLWVFLAATAFATAGLVTAMLSWQLPRS
jgi:hypothetical protein